MHWMPVLNLECGKRLLNLEEILCIVIGMKTCHVCLDKYILFDYNKPIETSEDLK